jgi:hypothetical protein
MKSCSRTISTDETEENQWQRSTYDEIENAENLPIRGANCEAVIFGCYCWGQM